MRVSPVATYGRVPFKSDDEQRCRKDYSGKDEDKMSLVSKSIGGSLLAGALTAIASSCFDIVKHSAQRIPLMASIGVAVAAISLGFTLPGAMYISKADSFERSDDNEEHDD